MKFIGQFIQDFIARFRNDVYLEDISTGTIASGGNLGLDSNNKIVKADTNAGELSITNATDNRVVTSTGGTGLNAESGLTFSTFLTLDGSTADIKIGSDATPFGYSPDVINTPYGQMSFVSYAVGGTGVGGLIEQSDLSAGTNTGAPLGIKAGGSFGSNKAGGNLELIAGRGTGTGAGGSFRFWSSTAGSSGSSYNTSAVKFTIDSDGDVDITGGATVAGLINATSGAVMLGDSYLVFSDSDNSNTTRVKSSTASTNRTILFPDADGTVALTSDIPDELVSNGQAFIWKYVKAVADQSTCNNMATTPVELIPAQGANTMIVLGPGYVMVDKNTSVPQANSAADLNFHFADLEPGTYGQTSLFHTRRFMNADNADRIYQISQMGNGFEVGQTLTQGTNKAIEASFDSAITNNSITSITFHLSYYVIDLS